MPWDKSNTEQSETHFWDPIYQLKFPTRFECVWTSSPLVSSVVLTCRTTNMTVMQRARELEFPTRFECSFDIFSTRFECSFNIFSTRFECSLDAWYVISVRTAFFLTFNHANAVMSEKIHSKRVENIWKLHSKRVRKLLFTNLTLERWFETVILIANTISTDPGRVFYTRFECNFWIFSALSEWVFGYSIKPRRFSFWRGLLNN